MPRSDLPFGSEFSPQTIDLGLLLELAHRHADDWQAFEVAVRDRYFVSNSTTDYNKLKLANNTKLSMRAYGLIAEKDTTLTDTGHALYALRDDPQELHKALARHILTECRGMAFVQCILDMQAANETITLKTLRPALEERGIHVPRGGKHMSTMRLWLEKAGIFSTQYRVDHDRLEAVLGVGTDDFDALAMLSTEQRTYLKTLANMGSCGPHSSNDIEKLATATYGVTFDEKNLPKQVLYPLRDAGFISAERGTKEHHAIGLEASQE